MPGIKKLDRIYQSDGLIEAKKHLEGNITITEKLDAHRFSFQVNEDKKVSYYKKNDNREISKIDRIITDLYERAIVHIESLPKSILKNIPKNTRFGFSYFPNQKPLRIKYSKIPESRLVLTDISSRSDVGKVRKVYEDQKYLDNWADILKVSKPPIIFQGVLEENQRDHILNLVKGTDSTVAFFSQHIEGIFEKTFSGNNIIEALVFKNKNGLTQLRDPSYKIFNEAARPTVSRDFYDLTIIQIQEFMENYEFGIFRDNLSENERYINLISDAYNKFIDADLIDENFNPEFLKPNIIGTHGCLGRKFIRNNETLQKINRSALNEELFKVFLISLHRKKSPHGLLNQSIINSFNQTIEKIQESISANDGEGLLSYHETIKILEGNNVKLDDQQPNYIKVVSSLQKSFNKEIKHKEIEPLPKAICIIGKFDFITKKHIDLIEGFSAENVIIVNLSKKKLKLSKELFQLEDREVDKILKSLQDENDNIKEIVNCSYYSLEKIFYKVRKVGYEPINFYVNEKSIANYSIQYNTIKHILGDRLKISKDFDISGFSIDDKRTIFRSIEDDDYVKFKEVSPKILKNFWEIYKSRYNIWKKE